MSDFLVLKPNNKEENEKKIKNMNNKMSVNTYLSTFESKKQNKWASRTHRHREHFDSRQMGGGFGEKSKGIKKYKFVVIELSLQCKVQHMEYSQ